MRKTPTAALRAWAATPQLRKIASWQCRKMNAERWPGPRCGAKKRDGGVCQNLPMENGRCRLHGGKTPKGSQWHVLQNPASTAPEALERKLRDHDRAKKRRAAVLAQMTPERRQAYKRWQQSHRPGDPKQRAADRDQRKQNREAAEILRRERPPSPRSAERAALVAQIEALERQDAEAAGVEAYDGVFS